MLRPKDIERALVVTAHPDDVYFGAAATVATLTDAGATVAYCLVTDGEAGGRDRDMPRADMAQLRREEQTVAAKHVGVDELVWLGWPDGRLVPDLDLSATAGQSAPSRSASATTSTTTGTAPSSA